MCCVTLDNRVVPDFPVTQEASNGIRIYPFRRQKVAPSNKVFRGAPYYGRRLQRKNPLGGNVFRIALRDDTDVILIGEMRDYETISLAMTAAETGHLVFGTLHTSSAAQTIDRIIDVCPIHAQDQVRNQL